MLCPLCKLCSQEEDMLLCAMCNQKQRELPLAATPPEKSEAEKEVMWKEMIGRLWPYNGPAKQKQDIGSSQSLIAASPLICRLDGSGSKASWKKELVDSCTGNLLVRRKTLVVSPALKRSLAKNVTPNLPNPKRQRTTAAKSIPGLQALNLSSVERLSNEVTVRIGMQSLPPRKIAGSLTSLQMFTYDIMGTSSELVLSAVNHLVSCGVLLSTGDQPVLESLEGPGTKRLWTHTQKIPALSSGMDTTVKRTLLLMSFVGLSESLTYSDGWTDIQCWWKSKDPVQS
ncbi:MAG: replication-associated protein [Cressdnaviricota sp.]|nr:MAG: replication-associated protein [Cressdnaviricota sp.]